MALGIGNMPIEIVTVDQEHDLCQYAARSLFHRRELLAIAGDDDQIGEFAQASVLAVGAYQGGDILARIRSR